MGGGSSDFQLVNSVSLGSSEFNADARMKTLGLKRSFRPALFTVLRLDSEGEVLSKALALYLDLKFRQSGFWRVCRSRVA